MAASSRSPWVPNYVPSEQEQEQSRIVINLWDYFSSAAAGLCQLYKGKLDKCADFQCLADALSPLDQFFKGSQRFFEDAVHNGRFTGAQCVRLQLRDLAHASAVPTTEDGEMKLMVPLQVLLAHELGASFCIPSNSLGKRHLPESGRGFEVKRICLGRCRRALRKKSKSSSTHSAFSKTGSTLLFDKKPGLDLKFEAYGNKSISPGRRRTYEESLLSCESDRYLASISHDPFSVFQDAARMANLLDPLSKFSVTPQSEKSPVPTVPPKRLRLDTPATEQTPQLPSTSM